MHKNATMRTGMINGFAGWLMRLPEAFLILDSYKRDTLNNGGPYRCQSLVSHKCTKRASRCRIFNISYDVNVIRLLSSN